MTASDSLLEWNDKTFFVKVFDEAPDEEVLLLFVILSVGMAKTLSDEFKAFDECTPGFVNTPESDQ